MQRRFADAASIEYIDTGDAGERAEHEPMVETIRERGLIYPVTVIDGAPVYDGAISYPGILRAVQTKLDTPE